MTQDRPGESIRTESTGAIYRINEDGTGLTKLVDLGGRTEYPVPGPDGTYLYFQSPVTGRSQVYRSRWDGSDVTNLT
ncbi:MAG: TolB family protein, partial [Phycisphaerae bacterium]